MIPILICNRDLLTSVQEQVRFFQQIPEAYIVLCDCASTYPPLVEWYAHLVKPLYTRSILVGDGIHPRDRFLFPRRIGYPVLDDCPDELILFPDNRGPRGTQSIIHELEPHDYYFMSDADMDYTGIDPTFLDDLRLGLDSCPEMDGVGVSIRLDDLPQTPMGDYARHVEEANWGQQYTLDDGDEPVFYYAPCDTAGVLRRTKPNWLGGYTGLRSVKHVARHLPWYMVDEKWMCPKCNGDKQCTLCENVTLQPPDFQHFYANASPRGTTYTSRVLDGSRPL